MNIKHNTFASCLLLYERRSSDSSIIYTIGLRQISSSQCKYKIKNKLQRSKKTQVEFRTPNITTRDYSQVVFLQVSGISPAIYNQNLNVFVFLLISSKQYKWPTRSKGRTLAPLTFDRPRKFKHTSGKLCGQLSL